MTTLFRNAVSIAALLATATTASAVLVGTDGDLKYVSGVRDTNATSAPSGDALDAKTEWAKFVAVTGTETFSGFSNGAPTTPSGALSLASIGATLTCAMPPIPPDNDPQPNSCVTRDTPTNGRYDTSGDAVRYLQSIIQREGDIVLSFGGGGIAAFAFYMTDANDFLSADEGPSSSDKKIELTDAGGGKTMLTVVTGDARENGNLQFFGFYNSGPTRYTSIRFINTNVADGFGIDDLLVGRFTGDIDPGGPTLPEPGTLALIGAALAGIGLRKRRQRV